MTPQKAQIQALINEIDDVLNKPSPRLPWVMSGETDQQRQVLEQTRSYLLSLQQQMGAAGDIASPSPLTTYPQGQASAAESAQQVLQAVLQEMNYLRSNVMQPMRTDIENLQQQREALNQEIRMLEAQRQQYALAPQQINQQQIITEFLQSLMGRLQEHLTGQVSQMLVNLETQAQQDRMLSSAPLDESAISGANYQPLLSPTQRLEQLQAVQAQSDQLLLRLDSTLRVIFESLQTNIQSYQDSLSQGLDKMHNLGQQGEAMFSALVNRLAQQLGREASTYLQSSIQTEDWSTARPPLPATIVPTQDSVGASFSLSESSPAAQSDEISEAQIDLLLNELKMGEPTTVIQPPTVEPSTEEPLSTVLPSSSLDDLDLTDLELAEPESELTSHLEQSDAGDTAGEDTIFQLDESLTTFQLDDDDEMTFFQLEDDLNGLQTLEESITTSEGTDTGADINDLDSALDLLNQLSADLQSDGLSATEDDLLASSDRSTTDSLPDIANTNASGSYDNEMSELYESLFGINTQDDIDLADANALEPEDQHIADANLFTPEVETSEMGMGISFQEASSDVVIPDERAGALLNDSLFAGLEDPSQDQIFTPQPLESVDSLSESFEGLLGESLLPDSELFESAPPSPVDPVPTNPVNTEETVDSIASLSDLIGAPEPNVDSELTDALQTETDVSSLQDEDIFIPAAPDEVLLVSDDVQPEPRADIRLNPNTLNQLTADLSSLEGFDSDLPFESELLDEPQPSDISELDEEDLFGELSSSGELSSAGELSSLGELSSSDDLELSDLELSDLELDFAATQGEPELPSELTVDEEPVNPLVESTLSLDEEVDLLTTGLAAAEVPDALQPAPEITTPVVSPTDTPLPADLEEVDLLLEDLAATGDLTAADVASSATTELDPQNAFPIASPIDHPLPFDPDPDELPSEITEVFEVIPTADAEPASPSTSDAAAVNNTTIDDLFSLSEDDIPPLEEDIPDLQELLSDSTPTDSAARSTDAALTSEDLFLSDDSDVSDESESSLLDLQELLSSSPETASSSSSSYLSQDEPLDEDALERLLSDESLDASFTEFTEEPIDPIASTSPSTAPSELSIEDLFSDSSSEEVFSDEASSESSGLTLQELEAALPTPTPSDDESLSLEGLFSDESTTPDVTSEESQSNAGATQAALTLGDFEDELIASSTLDAPSPEDDASLSSSVIDENLDSLFVETSSQSDAEDLSELTLGEFGDQLLTPLSPPSPDITPASAALQANDTASPPPPTPLEDNATIDDFFASALPTTPATVASQPDDSDLFSDSELAPLDPSSATGEDEANAFTLEGLVDSLFEDAPSIETSSSTLSSLEDAEKKNTLAQEAEVTGLDASIADDEAVLAADAQIEGLELEDLELELEQLDAELESQADRPLELTASLIDDLEQPTLSDLDLEPNLDLEALDVEPEPELGDDRPPLELTASLGTDLEQLDLEQPELEQLDLEQPALEELDLNELALEQLETEALIDDEGDRALTSDPAFAMLDLSEELGIDPDELEALLETDFSTDDFSLPPVQHREDTPPKIWYLGIDFGTTGVSAVLMNREKGELYPIYWSQSTVGPSQTTFSKSFRLPTRVYLSTPDRSAEAEATPGFVPQGNLIKVSFTPPTAGTAQAEPIAIEPGISTSDFLLQDFKPYLKVGIPYYSPETSFWEPVLQWSDHQQISLSPIHQALRALIATISNSQSSTPTPGVPTCAAVGIDEGAFQAALRQLAGVIVGYPTNWSDTYSFNLREAIIGSRLVTSPDQIFLVEDVIATLLSGLRSADGRVVALPQGLGQKSMQTTDWHGPTLAINAGATVTDLAMVDLPLQVENLSYQDFQIRSLPYAGNAIDQDIICQLIYPAWRQQAQQGSAAGADNTTLSYTFGSGNGTKSGTAMDGWNWQSSETKTTLETGTWEDLGLESLDLPLPGEPDPQNRFRLHQRLANSPLGQGLLEAARYLKLTLQQQDRLTLRLGNQELLITRQDLGSRVFLPFIQRLNRELNALLTHTGVSTLGINQVVCTGGTASLGAIARWLREKFPNATIIQDTYAGNRAPSPRDNCLPTCSRVAYGLAALPFHPKAINLVRQQYSDYFLLLELLRAFPDQAMSVGSIMQLLERRGINTQTCYTHILALLEGHLPPGLVPTERDAYLLTPESRQNSDYRVLLAAPLFVKQNNQTYRPNYEQWNHFRRYLSTIMASTYQKLAEPLSMSLAVREEG